MHVVGIPEGEEIEMGTKEIFEIIAIISPKLVSDTKSQTQKGQKSRVG